MEENILIELELTALVFCSRGINPLTLSVPQAVKHGSPSLNFCTPSRETRLANKRLHWESTIGR